MDPKRYWAKPPEELEGNAARAELEQRVVSKLQTAAQSIERLGELFDVWAKAYDAFHRALGREVSSAFVGRRGDSGQALTFATGGSRSLAQASAALISSAPTTLKAEASNTEAKAQAAAQTGTVLLEHEWLARGLAMTSDFVVECAAWAGEWFLWPSWDEMLGDVVAVEDGRLVRAGGIRYETLPPWRVLREPKVQSFEDSPWVAWLVRRGRHELAARYPEFEGDIMASGAPAELWTPERNVEPLDDDQVWLTVVYHRPTAALELGLLATLVGDTLVEIQPAPRRCPIARMSAGELTGTPWGYAPFWETLAASDLLDDGWSGLLTSLRVLGKPLVSTEKGSELDLDALGDEGPQVLYRRAGTQPPVAVQFSQPPTNADKLLDGVKAMQRDAVGLNDYALGQPPGSQLNAQAIALLISAATVRTSPFQARRVVFLRELGHLGLELYREHARSPTTVAIVGESSKGQLEKAITFSPQDLSGCDVVRVDVASGLSATAAGRVELLNIYKAHGVQVGPEDIVSVLNTGQLRQTLNRPQAEAQLLAWEERELRAGRVPKALFSDVLTEHMDHHLALLADPAIRADEGAVSAIEEHVARHLEVLQTTDPRVLALSGVQLPQLGAPGGPPASPEDASAPVSGAPEAGFGGAPEVEPPEEAPEAFQQSAPFGAGGQLQ